MSAAGRFVAALAVLVVAITMTVAAVLVASTGTRDVRSVPVSGRPGLESVQVKAASATSVDGHLNHDLDMTRFMSRPDGPWTAMTRGQGSDAQLERSRDPAYVRQLEQRQAEIDRMLAAPSR